MQMLRNPVHVAVAPVATTAERVEQSRHVRGARAASAKLLE